MSVLSVTIWYLHCALLITFFFQKFHIIKTLMFNSSFQQLIGVMFRTVFRDQRAMIVFQLMQWIPYTSFIPGSSQHLKIWRIKTFHCRCKQSAEPIITIQTMCLHIYSGTTGQPKGVQHPTGGHAVVNKWTMETIYGMRPGDTWYRTNVIRGYQHGHVGSNAP